MAPAAKCEGCGMKWKTAHEPAAPGEVIQLLNKTSYHAATVVDHNAKFTRHDTTPTKGFENATVVKAE